MEERKVKIDFPNVGVIEVPVRQCDSLKRCQAMQEASFGYGSQKVPHLEIEGDVLAGGRTLIACLEDQEMACGPELARLCR